MRTINPHDTCTPTGTHQPKRSLSHPNSAPIFIRQNNRQKRLLCTAKNTYFFPSPPIIFIELNNSPKITLFATGKNRGNLHLQNPSNSCQTVHGDKPLMTKRKLGNSPIEIAPLALGGNVFGWTIDQPTSFKILDAFVDAGFTFIDTADIYSTWVPGNKGGESETIIGNWLKQTGKRSKVIIATKVGLDMSPTDKGLSKAYILRAVEASLKRLQTDHIDLYQSHKDDPETPLDETLQAYSELVKQGKVRVIGASNYDKNRLAEALRLSEENAWPRYESLQPHYNLYDRADFETNLEELCLSSDVGVIPYYALASGFLTGKYRSQKDTLGAKRGQGITKFLNDRGFRILAALDTVAKEHNANPTRVALAWLMARPSITAPIASATSLEQLQDLTEAVNLKLSPEAINQLNEASAT
jgi:aryl-alcohol dehydrogenase-like predicted oxidoreductase